ncbi:MAG TPA: phospholipase D-like domain-containing protein [Solirubrobacterales bacterium]|nr:phospholipase D-like domain-containing protein [Solirubrobacterales bacterium]
MSAQLRFSVHRGDGAALLAFDVDGSLAPELAGFAVECEPPGAAAYPILNRLSFGHAVTADTTPSERRWTPTTEAPIQKFHWIHYPKDVPAGTFTYRATAMLFAAGSESELVAGPTAEFSLELRDGGYGDFKLGFTRGYISSQAYAERFENAAIEPDSPTIGFDTAPYEDQYRWLGAHARKLLFELIDETVADPQLSLDVFAYDFDEPDVITKLAELGPRLRLYLDNSSSHVAGKGSSRQPREVEALEKITASAGADNVKVGHFSRYAHDKILIQKRGEDAIKVLSGSANFSVRGLYVQSNNVFVFDDPTVAALYEQAFTQAWTDASGFGKSSIAAQWFPEPHGTKPKLPDFQVSFAPHSDPEVSLRPVADAIKEAKSSVLFSIMEIGTGSGAVLDAVRALPDRSEIYAFGTTQRLDGSLKVTSPGTSSPVFIPFEYLHSKVPKPFRVEISGGSGQVIHHKFVVVDFTGPDAVVFAGSSNLAAGGEHENGDNLLAFRGPAVASTYAVEAIRLVDHYRFREAMLEATEDAPLQLATRSANWTAPYFDTSTPKYRERMLFAPARPETP